MKALVTGATGLIGSTVVCELLKDGVEVRAMVRETSKTRNLDGLDIEKVYGDIRDADSMTAALKSCDVFYQVAALYVNSAPKQLYYDINVEGTKTALTAAYRLLGPQGVLFLSMPNMETIVWQMLDDQGANSYWRELAHYHNFSRARLYALLEEQGFSPLAYHISERNRACMEVIALRR